MSLGYNVVYSVICLISIWHWVMHSAICLTTIWHWVMHSVICLITIRPWVMHSCICLTTIWHWVMHSCICLTCIWHWVIILCTVSFVCQPSDIGLSCCVQCHLFASDIGQCHLFDICLTLVYVEQRSINGGSCLVNYLLVTAIIGLISPVHDSIVPLPNDHISTNELNSNHYLVTGLLYGRFTMLCSNNIHI